MTWLLTIGVTVIVLGHPPEQQRGAIADQEPDQRYNTEEEAFIHTSPGFDQPGRPATVEAAASTLQVVIVDAASGRPTPCRVNIVGADGNFYEPADNQLAPWSRHRTAHNETHGPSRYFGFHFYTPGQFEVQVPPGPTRVQVWKGYEFQPREQQIDVRAHAVHNLRVVMQRTARMDTFGYYSGDIHIHLDRHDATDDQRALDLMEAEDIRYGFLLCMNTGLYHGAMERQDWQQRQGFGDASVVSRGIYGIASGQEYRCGTYGHICLLMHDRLVLEGTSVDPNNWPVFGLVGEETRRLGGFSFHAHGGSNKEIFADYVQRSTDGVELLQMSHYRGVGLTGWYKILNVGYRFPALAGSDFPYCRALGDCRNYVYAPEQPSFNDWARFAAAGRSFCTTGPLLMLEVDGHRPGDTIERSAASSKLLNVKLSVRCEVTSVTDLQLLVNGRVARHWTLPDAAPALAQHPQRKDWLIREYELPVAEPTWIAARAFSLSATGRPDAEAHTNPVYVYVDGRRPFSAQDRDWLLEQLDARIAELERRNFFEKPQAVEYFRRSRQLLQTLGQ